MTIHSQNLSYLGLACTVLCIRKSLTLINYLKSKCSFNYKCVVFFLLIVFLI